MIAPDATRRESEVIRSEIEMTRQRLDETLGAIGGRMSGRHMVNEILGFVAPAGRKHSGRNVRTGKGGARDASPGWDLAIAAARKIGGVVREHPLPALLAAAAVAFLVRDMTKKDRSDEK